MGPNFTDEIDCGNFFDQIDNLIKFPADGECGGYLAGSGDSNAVPAMWNDAFPDSEDPFSRSHADDLLVELSVPYEEIAQLEWLSTFVEDSFSSGGGLTMGKENSVVAVKKEVSSDHFQTSSPVSVLESSSSSSSSSAVGKSTPPLSPSSSGLQRARSKRPRPPAFNPRSGIIHPFISSASSSLTETENFADSSSPVKKPSAEEPLKKKKIKITTLSKSPADTPSPETRKCLHCEITKTPQWRAGPMGPKTLCNACGVRYKSGRLFPEYRPAASPTFVPSLHSNSHKKVIEMRTKPLDTPPAATPLPSAATKTIAI